MRASFHEHSDGCVRGDSPTRICAGRRIRPLPATGEVSNVTPRRHGRIGGWNDSAVSQGKKIQVSCDTSVMNVSTSGLPFGLA